MEYLSKIVYKTIFRKYGLRRGLDLNKYPNIYNYINNLFGDSYSFNQSLKRYFLYYSNKFNNEELQIILHKPKCKTCGKPVKFVGKKFKLVTQYCCNSCAGKNKETVIKKQNSDRAKHNGKLGWNKNTPEKILARKNTLIKKYGTWKTACKEIQLLSKNGVKLKYGVDSIMNVDKIKIKRNNSLSCTRKITKSKMEDQAYEILKYKYSDIIRQYSSDLYPYLCDFYIPSMDLYIEFNGSQFHNGRPFLNTDKDIKEVNALKDKSKLLKKLNGVSKTQYDMIIYTWTDLDVRKRKIAHDNKLNFVEFWNINDVYEFAK